MSAQEKAADTAAAKPFLSVVSGNPSDEDVAVLTAVLAAAGSASGETGPVTRNDWGRPVDMHRSTLGLPSSYPNRG